MRFGKAALFLLVLLVVFSGFTLFLYFKDTAGPDLTISGPVGNYVGATLEVEATDKDSGLQSLEVVVTQADKTTQVLRKVYDKGVASAKETVNLEPARLKEGPLELKITALDSSIYRFGNGAKTEKTLSLAYDNRPPVVGIVGTAHYINQGGAGFIVYSLSEEAKKTGVVVDDLFFPGYKLDNGNYGCFFAYPYYLAQNKFQPKLMAQDLAGNERTTGFQIMVKPKQFRHDTINISDNFLNSKMPQFQEYFPDADSVLKVFTQVNSVLRIQNAKRLYDIGLDTSPRMLWEGAFLRQPDAAPMAGFGDVRSYIYNNQKIDEQTHLGIDLASLIQSPVPAANHGRVVLSEFFGIYGNCVIIDHGFGLQSLYSHLSQLDVRVGDVVQKGQIVGKTGATGLAGGDHLHFGINISGLPVSPIEWWDPHFIKDNIMGILSPVQAKPAVATGQEITPGAPAAATKQAPKRR